MQIRMQILLISQIEQPILFSQEGQRFEVPTNVEIDPESSNQQEVLDVLQAIEAETPGSDNLQGSRKEAKRVKSDFSAAEWPHCAD